MTTATVPEGRAPYVGRHRFVSIEEGFNIAHSSLSPQLFSVERARAFAPETPTGPILLDLRTNLGVPWPATTPLMLARYLRVRAGETLAARFVCGGAIHVVLQGCGEWSAGTDGFAWERGDTFIIPGAIESTYRADVESVLYCVTNEPLYTFERIKVEAVAQVEPVLYPAAAIAEQVRALEDKVLTPQTPGRAFNLSSAALAVERTALRALTATFNLILPGERQRPHKHCAAALSLVLRAGGCHSTIAGSRVLWQDDTVLLTPPLAPHTHENAGKTAALVFIVQDGALHYYTRTMDFDFTE